MPLKILVGTQWGDEGKGRIVDLLSAQSDYVARFNGGDNAGHTVTVASKTFKLHLIPSGIIHSHTLGILGNGLVINPQSLLAEMDMLHNAGIEVNPQRLKISFAAHMITAGHVALDKAKETTLGNSKIGTTGRGIGPAYTDKANRSGLRLLDLLSPTHLPEKLQDHFRQVNQTLQRLYAAPQLPIPENVDRLLDFASQLAPYISDTGAFLEQALHSQKRILAEGAQGVLLDIDHGSYPFVTSSNVAATGVFTGLGIGIQPVSAVIGATKAFQSRVGAGPFPTEVEGEMAELLRGTGANPWDEFGTTTGRPRRVGWLDGVLLRYASRINGLTELVLTKLDILSGLPAIQICTAYKDENGSQFEQAPMGVSDLQKFSPIYSTLPAWNEKLEEIREWHRLPQAARDYVRFVEKIVNLPVAMVSVGPERSQIISVPRE